MDQAAEYAAELLPYDIAAAFRTNPRAADVEEIRLRAGRPVIATVPSGEVMFSITASEADVAYVVERAAGSSLYAVQEELRSGFVTSGRGVRVGVCGRISGGAMTSFTSVNVRVPREYPRAADEAYPRLVDNGRALGTLIASPPGAGKTTFLRALTRRLSDDARLRVAVADERGELTVGHAAGERVDAVAFCPKAEAVLMLLRSMSPQVVALDEITSPDDAHALLAAAGTGASVVATVHGEGRGALSRPWMRGLADAGVFERLVTLRVVNGVRAVSVSGI